MMQLFIIVLSIMNRFLQHESFRLVNKQLLKIQTHFLFRLIVDLYCEGQIELLQVKTMTNRSFRPSFIQGDYGLWKL